MSAICSRPCLLIVVCSWNIFPMLKHSFSSYVYAGRCKALTNISCFLTRNAPQSTAAVFESKVVWVILLSVSDNGVNTR